MKAINKAFIKVVAIVVAFFAIGTLQSCDDNKSYTELLNEETEAVNWFLAQNRVVTRCPPTVCSRSERMRRSTE